MMRQQAQRFDQATIAHPLLKTAMTGLVRRVLRRKLRPMRARAEYPKNAVQHSTRVPPRTTAFIRASRWLQHRSNKLPLHICQIPASCHPNLRKIPEHPQFRRSQSLTSL